MALRQLRWAGRGTQHAADVLQAWCEDVIGKPYELTLRKLLAWRTPDAVPASAAAPGFFCSELCANAYQHLGVLSVHRPASEYWPVQFGNGKTLRPLPLINGASFGGELPIDLSPPPSTTSVELDDRPGQARGSARRVAAPAAAAAWVL